MLTHFFMDACEIARGNLPAGKILTEKKSKQHLYTKQLQVV